MIADISTVTRLVDRIRPIMAGHEPEVQGAAIADLAAIHLAGHFVPDDAAATARVREELLSLFVDAVRDLIPINERMIREPDAGKDAPFSAWSKYRPEDAT